MKRIITTPISSTNGFPWKKGTIEFIQDAYKEMAAEAVVSRIPQYNPAKTYILRGIELQAGTNFTEGTLLSNGEIFHCPAQTVPIVSGYRVANIKSTPYTIFADPVQFTGGGAPVNVHLDRTVEFTFATTGSGQLGKFDEMIRISTWAQYPITTSLSPSVMDLSSASIAYIAYKIEKGSIDFNCKIDGATPLGSPYVLLIDIPVSLQSYIFLTSPRVMAYTRSTDGLLQVDFETSPSPHIRLTCHDNAFPFGGVGVGGITLDFSISVPLA